MVRVWDYFPQTHFNSHYIHSFQIGLCPILRPTSSCFSSFHTFSPGFGHIPSSPPLHGDHKDDNDDVDDDGIMIALIMMTRLMMVKVTLIAWATERLGTTCAGHTTKSSPPIQSSSLSCHKSKPCLIIIIIFIITYNHYCNITLINSRLKFIYSGSESLKT